MASKEGVEVIPICAKVESELAEMDEDDSRLFMKELGIESSGLDRLIDSGYKLLEQITFFTAGKKEVKAWEIRSGSTAPEAAGKIHTDFEKGFIRAETISFNDFVNLSGEAACREEGKLRQEGKEYIVKDGDIMHFLFNI